jgi:tripartite ATP-independent transporter DctM subunit
MFVAIIFVFFLILILGVPIAVVVGLTALIGLVVMGTLPLNALPQYMFSGLNSFPLLAIPFFVLAGVLMEKTGISKRLIDFTLLLFGRMPGALAIVNIVTSIFFAGITGAAVADTAAVGGVLIPAMKKQGYSAAYSAAVTAASSCIGPIIPPSIILVVYGIAANTSIAALLIAGIIPGVLLGVIMGIFAFIQAIKNKFPKSTEVFSLPGLGAAFFKAIPVLLMPLIIIGGIMGGVFTPTEAACIAVVYSFFLGIVIKTLKIGDLPGIFIEASIVTGIVLLIISTAKVFSIVLVMNQIPAQLAGVFLGISQSKVVILLMINILLLIVGCFMEISAACIILAPILLPVVVSLGVHPVHFGIIMCLNLALGLATPPVGPTLFVACRIAETSIAEITREIVPYLIAGIVTLFFVTFIPQLSLWLPSVFIG